MPESMAIVAEQLGATVARPEQPAVRELALVHRAGPLSPAATRFTELPIPVGTSGDLMRPSEPMPGSGCGWHRHPYPSKPMDTRVDSRYIREHGPISGRLHQPQGGNCEY